MSKKLALGVAVACLLAFGGPARADTSVGGGIAYGDGGTAAYSLNVRQSYEPLFTSEILAEVEKRFAAGGLRYKAQAVKNVLSTYGTEFIAKIQLTKTEDMPRTCDKPRCKWYLIQGQMEVLRDLIETRKGIASK